ncbi:MAG: tRNA guanosine(34) transglycosylase Tgt [Phycisphaeraceae bacterium]|nr:tRNA guanosine(34) transglycosylase Tgt [Phycisphaeraceae bacterium]
MGDGPITFEISASSDDCGARAGSVTTPHGSFDTPAFMTVGTRASVKGLWSQVVADLGARIILANTYHLMLRPGAALIAEMGGLHAWSRWNRPILTDSGGYQVFSLTDLNEVHDDGVTFRSHLDGALIHLTPEVSIQAQNDLGADIIMAFDDCPPAPEDGGAAPSAGAVEDYRARVEQACDRTARWLERCRRAHRRDDQALFGIVQGGVDLEQRTRSVEQVCQHDLPGYAIGGVAVGEGFEGLRHAVEHTAPLLPEDRPRYLMGVGYERDILTAVRAGVDMFDCVLPTRHGRNANAFTPQGPLRLRNQRFARDASVLDPGCDCPACAGGYSRSYLRHLFQSGEMLGPILASAHNVRHFQRFLLDIRRAIVDNGWSLIRRRWPVLDAPT